MELTVVSFMPISDCFLYNFNIDTAICKLQLILVQTQELK